MGIKARSRKTRYEKWAGDGERSGLTQKVFEVRSMPSEWTWNQIKRGMVA